MNYIGIDIGGTNLKAGLVNDEGSILAMEKRKIAEVSDQKALVEALVALTQSLTERGRLTPEQIRSVGVGVPGAVEIHSGAVLYTCNLPLRGTSPSASSSTGICPTPCMWRTTPTVRRWRNTTPEPARAASALSPSRWRPAWERASFTTDRSITVPTAWPARWAT